MGIKSQAELLVRIEQLLEGASPEDVSAVVFDLWRTRGKHPVLTPNDGGKTLNGNTEPGVFSTLGGHDRGGRSVRVRKLDPVREKQALELLEFLNLKAERRYRPVEENLRFLRARLNTSTPDDIRGVIARKTREWKNTEMAKHLRPATLFNATKFEQYIGEQGS